MTRADKIGAELRRARRTRAVDESFAHYTTTPIDDARATRITTLTHDILTHQPAWLIDGIRTLYENNQLNTCDVPSLATRIVEAAAHQDRQGQLPERWIAQLPGAHQLPSPSTVLDVPGR